MAEALVEVLAEVAAIGMFSNIDIWSRTLTVIISPLQLYSRVGCLFRLHGNDIFVNFTLVTSRTFSKFQIGVNYSPKTIPLYV